MIEKEKIVDIVKFRLPKVQEDVVNRISEEVIREVEIIMHALIRQVVAHEREQLYRNSLN